MSSGILSCSCVRRSSTNSLHIFVLFKGSQMPPRKNSRKKQGATTKTAVETDEQKGTSSSEGFARGRQSTSENTTTPRVRQRGKSPLGQRPKKGKGTEERTPSPTWWRKAMNAPVESAFLAMGHTFDVLEKGGGVGSKVASTLHGAGSKLFSVVSAVTPVVLFATTAVHLYTPKYSSSPMARTLAPLNWNYFQIAFDVVARKQSPIKPFEYLPAPFNYVVMAVVGLYMYSAIYDAVDIVRKFKRPNKKQLILMPALALMMSGAIMGAAFPHSSSMAVAYSAYSRHRAHDMSYTTITVEAPLLALSQWLEPQGSHSWSAEDYISGFASNLAYFGSHASVGDVTPWDKLDPNTDRDVTVYTAQFERLNNTTDRIDKDKFTGFKTSVLGAARLCPWAVDPSTRFAAIPWVESMVEDMEACKSPEYVKLPYLASLEPHLVDAAGDQDKYNSASDLTNVVVVKAAQVALTGFDKERIDIFNAINRDQEFKSFLATVDRSLLTEGDTTFVLEQDGSGSSSKAMLMWRNILIHHIPLVLADLQAYEDQLEQIRLQILDISSRYNVTVEEGRLEKNTPPSTIFKSHYKEMFIGTLFMATDLESIEEASLVDMEGKLSLAKDTRVFKQREVYEYAWLLNTSWTISRAVFMLYVIHAGFLPVSAKDYLNKKMGRGTS